jgi:tetratricopeptide (TPR) repeat protein
MLIRADREPRSGVRFANDFQEVVTVKATLRCAVAAACAIALAAAFTPGAAVAQRGGQPAEDTPRILIPTFHSPDQGQGLSVAEAIRSRVQQETPAREMAVVPREDINRFLKGSGFPEDIALNQPDLKELAKFLRADYILDGNASKATSGVRIDARLMLARDVGLAQPLPPIEGKDAGAAAKQLEKELSEARKQLVDNRRCENAIRGGKFDEAIAAAREGIRKYPRATLARLCLMTAFSQKKLGPDSVLSVTDEILKLDSLSSFALRNAIAAYQEKADTASVVRMSIRLARLDPSARGPLIGLLASLKQPEVALPLVQEMLNDDSGDVELLKMHWSLLRAAKRWKEALVAGEAYVKADTSAATADYFTIMAATAASDSQYTLGAEIASLGVEKFPKDADLWMLNAQMLRKAGKLPEALGAALKAYDLNPKVEFGAQFVTAAYSELNQQDSALAFARRSVAAGADKAAIGNALTKFVASSARAAQEAGKVEGKGREEWIRAFQTAMTVDSIAPNEQTKFFSGVSAFQVGMDAYSKLNATAKASTTKACEETKLIEDMWAVSQINMPQGAKVDTQTAGQIMGAIQQLSPAVSEAKKQLCKPAAKSKRPE